MPVWPWRVLTGRRVWPGNWKARTIRIRRPKSMRGYWARLLADSLQLVSVGIDDERGVVGRPIVGAQAGRAGVRPAVRQGGGMEDVDGLTARRGQGQVAARG